MGDGMNTFILMLILIVLIFGFGFGPILGKALFTILVFFVGVFLIIVIARADENIKQGEWHVSHYDAFIAKYMAKKCLKTGYYNC